MSRDPRDRIAPETSAEELRAELEAALRFIWKHHSGNSVKAARARAVAVIELIERHLDDLGIERSLTSPLGDIYLALAEAERGVLDPLFKPKPLSSRPPTTFAMLWVMMKASLAIDLFMAA